MIVTLESLTKAFIEWDKQAAEGGWTPGPDPKENAVSRAAHLMSLLENNS